MPPTFDTAAAARFLEQSRSRFLREAGQWLVALDDPADVLILLSGDVGQHLGPWDCFRHCALLGLHHSAAVKSLALDVLSEEPDPGDGPPIAPAFAVAWAHDRFPEEDAPFAEGLLAMLQATHDDARVPKALNHAAQLALCGPSGAAADELRAEVIEAAIDEHLLGDDQSSIALAVPVWEAAVVSGASSALAMSRELAIVGQQADGGLTALSDNVLLRGFATLRGLALEQRTRAGGSAPSSS